MFWRKKKVVDIPEGFDPLALIKEKDDLTSKLETLMSLNQTLREHATSHEKFVDLLVKAFKKGDNEFILHELKRLSLLEDERLSKPIIMSGVDVGDQYSSHYYSGRPYSSRIGY